MTITLAAESNGGSMLASIFMAAGVAMLVMLVVVNMRAKLRRRQNQEQLTPHEKVERIKQTHGMKNDLRDMMVELEDLTRRFSAQLDAKAVRLEKLIEEADERIARLDPPTAPPTDFPTPSAADPATSSARPPAAEAEEAASDGGRETADAADDPLTRDIYELADAGHEPAAIARQVDEHIGKVELILALREQ